MGRKIKTLRSKNGGNCTSKDFNYFMCRCWDNEGVDCFLQPTIEQGGRKK
jgi:hypothetical protein